MTTQQPAQQQKPQERPQFNYQQKTPDLLGRFATNPAEELFKRGPLAVKVRTMGKDEFMVSMGVLTMDGYKTKTAFATNPEAFPRGSNGEEVTGEEIAEREKESVNLYLRGLAYVLLNDEIHFQPQNEAILVLRDGQPSLSPVNR